MYHEYPYSTYWHDIDKMCQMCKSLGYRLELNGDYLRLVDAKNNVISSVKIHFAEVAAEDVNGNQITSYIIDAGVSGTSIVLTHGDNSVTTLTIPYAEKANKDVQNKDIIDYTYNVSINGDNLVITKGDNSFVTLTIPFATKALTDNNGKNLTTYAASLETDGTDLVLRDSLGRELSRINTLDDTYATTIEAGVTTIKLKAGNGETLSEITVPYATKALTDADGNIIKTSYAASIEPGTNTIKLKAKDGSQLSEIIVPFAIKSADANNAIEQVSISGNDMIFTTYAGQSYTVRAPYAIKANKDKNNKELTSYIANVINDTQTGELKFYDGENNLIITLAPTVNKATYDNLNNTISDYINSVVADPQSDYVLVTHGDGTVDSIKIRYSEVAWKDTNNNVIKNTYCTDISIEPNPNDQTEMDLVGWNGDNPAAEIFRHPLDGLFGSLAFKDSVEATYTPAGTVTSAGTFTGEPSSISGSITPTGTISGTSVTLGTTTISEIDQAGTPTQVTLPRLSPIVNDEKVVITGANSMNTSYPVLSYVNSSTNYTDYNGDNLKIYNNPPSIVEMNYTLLAGWTAGSVTAGTSTTTKSTTVADGTATVIDGTFTGEASSISGSITPAGTISVSSSFSGTQTTIISE